MIVCRMPECQTTAGCQCEQTRRAISLAVGHAVTDTNAAHVIEHRMSELVDLLAAFPFAEINPKAWRQLLIYAPK